MYVPSFNRIEDRGQIVELMRQFPFATLVSNVDGVPAATHLPILVEPGEPVVLWGHMARQNRQWKALTEGESLIIFAGPHGYVSPTWYESRPNVPTWNYVSVHAYATAELIENDDVALDHLTKMVGTFDPHLGEAQPESMDQAFLRKLLPGIVVFRLAVTRVDGKAKLSQNKTEVDRTAVTQEFLKSPTEEERNLGQMMSEVLSR